VLGTQKNLLLKTDPIAHCSRYAVYQYQYQSVVGSTAILLHITPYGPSICDVMPYYTVLEYETSFDRRDKWSEFVSKVKRQSNCLT
jgi:hypothetical protein